MSDDTGSDATVLERIRTAIDERDGMTLIEITEERGDEVRIIVQERDRDSHVAYRVVSEPRIDGEGEEQLRWIFLGYAV